MTGPSPAPVPWRWGVVWLFFAATLLNYTDRLALANTSRFLLPEFAATPEAQRAAYADLNTAFGLAFALGQVAAGFLVDRFSLRWLYVAAILTWSAAGAATGLVPAGSLGLLVACRVALGVGESFNWPCAVAGIQRTVPRESRGLANGIFHGGASVGALCTPLVVVALVDTATGAGWRTVFLAVGALGAAWAAAWLLLTRGDRAAVIDTPLTVPGGPGPSLGAVLAGPLFWICLVSTCGVNVCWHLYNQWLPRHLADDLGVPAGRDQYLLAGFYLAADLGGMAAGWATRGLARSGVRVGRARQLVMTGLAAVTAAGSAAAVGVPAGDAGLKMAAFCAVAAAAVGGYAVVFALIQDTAPRHTALVLGLCGCGSWLLISGLNQVVKAGPGAGVPGWLFPAAGCAPLAAAAAGNPTHGDSTMRPLLLLLLAPLAAAAQAPAVPHPDKLAAIPAALRAAVDAGELAGAVAVVGRSAGVVHTSAVGKLRLDPAAPMPADAVFRIASMTKPVTAMAVMMLVEDGRIASVDDPVEEYLPEFRGQMLVRDTSAGAVTLVKPARPITLKDLLTHTSGLPSAYPPGLAERYALRSVTLAETTFAQSQRPLDFPPGSRWSYCNAGIDVLGRVVEAVSGRGYEEFLQARLFRPLGMTDTTSAPTPALVARLAPVYALTAGRLTPAPPGFLDAVPAARHPAPMGGLVSTAADLAKLYQCLLRGGELGGVRVLKPATLAAMTRAQTGDIVCGFTPGMSYGLGFAVVRDPQGVTKTLSRGSFGHGGAFGTQSWADPGHDVFVILLIARSGLPNGDGSSYRRAVQELAAAAVAK